MVYQHSQPKHVVCPQANTNTLNDTSVKENIQTQAITWLYIPSNPLFSANLFI